MWFEYVEYVIMWFRQLIQTLTHINILPKLDLSYSDYWLLKKEIRHRTQHKHCRQCHFAQHFHLEWTFQTKCLISFWNNREVKAGLPVNQLHKVNMLCLRDKNLGWANYSWGHVFINDPLTFALIKTMLVAERDVHPRVQNGAKGHELRRNEWKIHALSGKGWT